MKFVSRLVLCALCVCLTGCGAPVAPPSKPEAIMAPDPSKPINPDPGPNPNATKAP